MRERIELVRGESGRGTDEMRGIKKALPGEAKGLDRLVKGSIVDYGIKVRGQNWKENQVRNEDFHGSPPSSALYKLGASTPYECRV